jgi:hypothetical protein
MRLGRHASRDDLIDIFEYAEPNLVASVKEQREYFERWIGSLRDN